MQNMLYHILDSARLGVGWYLKHTYTNMHFNPLAPLKIPANDFIIIAFCYERAGLVAVK